MYSPNARFNPRANCSTWKGSARDIVLLARGRDDYGHFDIVGPPLHDLPFGESTVHSESMARRTRNVLPAGAGGKR